jgi:hypothetical protein
MKPFPHGKNLTQASLNVDGGSQRPPSSSINLSNSNVCMLKGESHIATRAHDYEMPSTIEKGKKDEKTYVPLQNERTMGEKMTYIPKGVFKKDSHNPNARDAQN